MKSKIKENWTAGGQLIESLFSLLLKANRTMLAEDVRLTEEEIDEMTDTITTTMVRVRAEYKLVRLASTRQQQHKRLEYLEMSEAPKYKIEFIRELGDSLLTLDGATLC